MLQLVHQHLLRAQTRMKCQADKRRLERSFSVGDMVFVKLQSSVAHRAHQKLAFHFFGPYPCWRGLAPWPIDWNCLISICASSFSRLAAQGLSG